MKRVQRLPPLPARAREAHKGDFGRVLVLAGSRGMIGAAALAGNSALRAGAGLVTIGAPQSVYPILAAQVTCCTTRPFEETREGTFSSRCCEEILSLAEGFDVVALGPGLGSNVSTTRLVHRLVAETPKPMVVDADGLNALAEEMNLLKAASHARILTPHPGEMARLLGLKSGASVQKNREGLAVRLAARYGAVVVLKGHRTVVTDGERVAVNATGNPGMASGGTGDVLTGVIAALLAQGLGPFEAAQLGAHVHGLAADLAAGKVGEVSLLATDILASLPRAFLKLAHGRRRQRKAR